MPRIYSLYGNMHLHGNVPATANAVPNPFLPFHRGFRSHLRCSLTHGYIPSAAKAARLSVPKASGSGRLSPPLHGHATIFQADSPFGSWLSSRGATQG